MILRYLMYIAIIKVVVITKQGIYVVFLTGSVDYKHGWQTNSTPRRSQPGKMFMEYSYIYLFFLIVWWFIWISLNLNVYIYNFQKIIAVLQTKKFVLFSFLLTCSKKFAEQMSCYLGYTKFILELYFHFYWLNFGFSLNG